MLLFTPGSSLTSGHRSGLLRLVEKVIRLYSFLQTSSKVRFESGPVGAQNVEIRVTDTPVDASQAADTLLTSGEGSEVIIYSLFSSDNTSDTKYLHICVSCQVCGGAGSTVDGVTTMDICCSLKVLFTNEMDNWQSSSSGKVCDSSGDGLLKQRVSGGG